MILLLLLSIVIILAFRYELSRKHEIIRRRGEYPYPPGAMQWGYYGPPEEIETKEKEVGEKEVITYSATEIRLQDKPK